MTALVFYFFALAFKWQTVYCYHVVEHTSEYGNHLGVLFPVKECVWGERVADKLSQVYRAQQTATIGR